MLNAGNTGYALIGRTHFGMEAVLRKVLNIQRHDEIRPAVFAPEWFCGNSKVAASTAGNGGRLLTGFPALFLFQYPLPGSGI